MYRFTDLWTFGRGQCTSATAAFSVGSATCWFLTARDTVEYQVEGLQAGADLPQNLGFG
jgi:hypothetical protein